MQNINDIIRYKSWITGRSIRSCRGRRGGERFGNEVDADKNEKNTNYTPIAASDACGAPCIVDHK